ncbi:DUF3027 domain-containing protein [Agromyces archimandritae]|uniref:DUF3027 domain-containing protein n=2 Tax=Agromyces archimandritae TaxID=2781962 RepID=A0A975FPN4_9MICO|nr:DUF3027 domain-containing protein [Agromyces archimandritae]
MPEEPTPAADPVPEEPTPAADPVLLAAAGLAREALLEITPAATIGDQAGFSVEGEHALTLRFHSLMEGYPGWVWTVTLARADGDAEPTVLETELMPAAGALLAPDWVPWSERMADYRAAQEAQAAASDDDAEEDTDDEDAEDVDADHSEDEFDDDDEDADEGFDGIDIDALADDADDADDADADADADDDADDDAGEPDEDASDADDAERGPAPEDAEAPEAG